MQAPRLGNIVLLAVGCVQVTVAAAVAGFDEAVVSVQGGTVMTAQKCEAGEARLCCS